MDELGPDEQRWLDALRGESGPDDACRARVRAEILATLATGTGKAAAAGAGLGKAAGIAKTASLFAPWKIGIAVASLALVGGGIAAVAVGSSKREAPSTTIKATHATALIGPASPAKPPIELPAPAEAAASAEIATSAENAAGAESAHGDQGTTVASGGSARRERHAGAHPRGSSSHARAQENDVDAELVLLTDAQQALKRGDADAALAALGRHAREHPRGALAVEREGLRAIASCEAKREGGRALAERFVARNPSSPLVARVRTACLSP